jgi:hypothetical protein
MTYIRHKNGNANFTYIEKFDDVEKAANPDNVGEFVEVKINDVKIEFTKVRRENDESQTGTPKVERQGTEKV